MPTNCCPSAKGLQPQSRALHAALRHPYASLLPFLTGVPAAGASGPGRCDTVSVDLTKILRGCKPCAIPRDDSVMPSSTRMQPS